MGGAHGTLKDLTTTLEVITLSLLIKLMQEGKAYYVFNRQLAKQLCAYNIAEVVSRTNNIEESVE